MTWRKVMVEMAELRAERLVGLVDGQFITPMADPADALRLAALRASGMRADKKKPADESGLKTIFLEENSGDRRDYAASPHIRPIAILDTRHQFLL